MQDIYKVKNRPAALPSNMIVGEKYRITFLTDALIRLEYSEDGIFEDRATQMVFYRDFGQVDFRILHTENGMEIHTKRLHIIYNEEEFSGHGLCIKAHHSTWRYGDKLRDLKGTARTLDEANGEIPLGNGIVSRVGFSVLDDSKSQILLEDGWIEPRKKQIQDLYFFGYGHDYKGALNDFYYLCGKTPMLPRFALGNWWSRYYKYTEKSYMELMDRFEKENLPFTVAVIDMDWHLVDIDPKYGSGWTGYTWNRDFFPDPERFLKNLHERGMKTTMNVHPAEGVAAHEEMYLDMAKAMGVDYENEDPVVCDLADPKYVENYFKYLHHPHEEIGVDFWWIDWQQGTNTKIEGLDPLWILNHFHFLDSQREGKRPMTFSRYAGPGSHRYPVGFSGDTHMTWESLDFQPYFTLTATNIGYGWWSHDIGGHMLGYKNDEMIARWTQFGVYSPILRLHSTCSEFNGKEPWRFKKETEIAMGEALRERHQLIPYLYTMNYRSYKENLPLVLPMYYEHPENRNAYTVKNQYYFGTELLVAPITTPRISGLNVAKVTTWLPKGIWYDIHTGMMYEGNRMLDMYRMIDTIPVLAKAGGILPLTDEISGVQAGQNPKSLRIKVFAGADNAFTLYEDDNTTCDYERGVWVTTTMSYCDNKTFTIEHAKGNLSLVPEERSYVLEFVGYTKEAAQHVIVSVDGHKVQAKVSYQEEMQAVVVELPKISIKSDIQITLDASYVAEKNQLEKRCFDFLNQAEIAFPVKDAIYNLILEEKRIPVLLTQLQTMELDKDLYGVLAEILTAR